MMMVWRPKGRDTYRTRVYPVEGERVIVSTGTTDEATANGIARWADDIAARGDRLGVVAAIAAKEMTLMHAYHLGETEAAAELKRRRAVLDAAAAKAKAINVWPLLEAYAAQRSKGKKPVKTAYTQLAMARQVFPEDPCPHWLWEDADDIELRLTELKGKTWKGKPRTIGDATRNRYKSVLSVLSEHLRRLKIISRNVMPDVASFAESSLDFTYLELADAETLIAALDEQGRVVAALALGFGMEWSAIAQCEARDVDFTDWSARPRGEKTHWRDRRVHLSDTFAFLKPILRKAVQGKTPRARLVTAAHDGILRRQQLTATALGIQPITIHNWRHSCAVILTVAGESAAVIAHILGHKDTALYHRRYGRFMVRAEHYVTRAKGGQPKARDAR